MLRDDQEEMELLRGSKQYQAYHHQVHQSKEKLPEEQEIPTANSNARNLFASSERDKDGFMMPLPIKREKHNQEQVQQDPKEQSEKEEEIIIEKEEKRAPQTPAEYRERLYEKFGLNDFGKNDGRITGEDRLTLLKKFKRVEIEEPKTVQYSEDIDQEDPDLIGPSLPKIVKPQEDSQKRQQDSSQEDQVFIPCSHQLVLDPFAKAANCLTIDNQGSRLIAGSHNSYIKFWDFLGMNRQFRAFKTYAPYKNHHMKALSFSPDGKLFLSCSGNSAPHIYPRDGGKTRAPLQTGVNGDKYIRDMHKTRGHTGMLTYGQWHPTDINIFMTSSIDGTVRIWDLTSKPTGIDLQLAHTEVIVIKNQDSLKCPALTCSYSPGGEHICVGAEDGSLQIFQNKKSLSFYRPDVKYSKAHLGEITSIAMLKDCQKMLSRAMDGTMKFWDIRYAKQALHTWQNLPNYVQNTQVSLSPDQQIALTGTSVKPGLGVSKIKFYSLYNYDLVKEISISHYSVIRAEWHPILNQIITTTSQGDVRVLYDPQKSQKGALLVNFRRKKRFDRDYTADQQHIFLPDEPKEFIELNPKLVDPPSDEDEPKIKPEKPPQGPFGKGGRISQAGSTTQFMMRTMHKINIRDEDPVKALLKYAEEAKNNPKYVDPIYKETQPVPIFSKGDVRAEQLRLLEEGGHKKCAQCGLKICVCLDSQKYTQND